MHPIIELLVEQIHRAKLIAEEILCEMPENAQIQKTIDNLSDILRDFEEGSQ